MSDLSKVLAEKGYPEMDLIPAEVKPKLSSIERAVGWLPGFLRVALLRLLVGKALEAAKKK